MDEQTNIIELVDENNETLSFEHIMTLDYNEKEYVVLSPLDNELDEEAEVIILRVEHDEDGEDYFVNIEDEDELEEVFSAVTEVYDNATDDEDE